MPVNETNDPGVGTTTDLDGGGQNDYFLSFSIALTDVVTQLALRGITAFDQNSPINFCHRDVNTGKTVLTRI